MQLPLVQDHCLWEGNQSDWSLLCSRPLPLRPALAVLAVHWQIKSCLIIKVPCFALLQAAEGRHFQKRSVPI